MNRPLKQAVRQHFAQRALSTEQLERLEARMVVDAPRPAHRRLMTTSWIGWSAAAAIAAFRSVEEFDDYDFQERLVYIQGEWIEIGSVVCDRINHINSIPDAGGGRHG